MLKSIEIREKISLHLVLRQLAWKFRLVLARQFRDQSRPVFILSSPRTGSSLLGNLLGVHPQVEDLGEVLNQRIARGLYHRFTGSRVVISHIQQHLACCESSHAIVKLHFNQMQRRSAALKDILIAFPNATWILLYRRQLIEQFVSLKLATGTRNFTEQSRDKETIHLDSDEWKDFIQRENSLICGSYKLLLLQKCRCLLVEYDDLARQPEATANRIFMSLGLPAQENMDIPLKKQETRPLSRIISNYESVQDSIGTLLEPDCMDTGADW